MGLTLRAFIEREIRACEASSIGPRRWRAEALRWLLQRFDEEHGR